jgi:hypothetical protein
MEACDPRHTLVGDLPEEEQQVVWATQGVPAANLFDQKMAGTSM